MHWTLSRRPVSKYPGMPSRRTYRRLAVVAGVVLLSVLSFLAWETYRAVRQARAKTVTASTIAVSIRPLDRAIPADVDSLGARAVFRDAALFRGHLYAGGPQGLVEYDANG